MEQKEKNDLICFFSGRGAGVGGVGVAAGSCREGRGADASQKRCELNCLQCKQEVYLLTIGYTDGN